MKLDGTFNPFGGHDLVNSKPDPIDNSELVRAFTAEGGRILHIRPGKFKDAARGMTFAYKRRGGRVTFSTSVQHRHDTFTKKVGTKLALEHFQNGNTVSMPISGADTDVVRNLGLVAQVIQF